MNRAATEYRYEKLTWPEINDAVEMQKVCIVPCGAVEQHGPHLPLDVDLVCPGGIANGAGRQLPEKILVLPTLAYGYTGHVMDFPGTINTHYETFIRQVLDVTKSLAYHGFKKIILLNGHGSNMPNLDLAARRTNLETDADCVVIAWWNLLTVDKAFLPSWRESKFPGGCSHACELETSLYLYLDEANVRKDKIKSGTISINDEDSPFNWVDLFAAGPAYPHFLDEQLFRDRRAGRCREGDEGERRAGLSRGGQAALPVRRILPRATARQAPPRAAPVSVDAHSLGTTGRGIRACNKIAGHCPNLAESSEHKSDRPPLRSRRIRCAAYSSSCRNLARIA